ncbi:hypothetical protein [Streptomyces sp. NPDC052107]|uniref:hypothetical protein n=1 Tax=Streptomyces sp. NPDC052107 TaxID=3155632 RepID=UPI003436FF77
MFAWLSAVWVAVSRSGAKARAIQVSSAHQVAVPAQDGVRGDQEMEPAQCRAGQRRQQRSEERPVLGSEPGALVPELPMQDGKLVTQGEDLGVLFVVGHRQQSQRCEGVGDSEVGEAVQHK